MNTHSYLKTQHVLTSLIECTLLTKTALSSVLEFSVHSKSKKKKKGKYDQNTYIGVGKLCPFFYEDSKKQGANGKEVEIVKEIPVDSH